MCFFKNREYNTVEILRAMKKKICMLKSPLKDILKCTNHWTHFPRTFDLHNMASVFETKKYLPPMTHKTPLNM